MSVRGVLGSVRGLLGSVRVVVGSVRVVMGIVQHILSYINIVGGAIIGGCRPPTRDPKGPQTPCRS